MLFPLRFSVVLACFSAAGTAAMAATGIPAAKMTVGHGQLSRWPAEVANT